MRKIYAVVLRYDTEAKQADDIDVRKTLVEDSLRDAYAFIKKKLTVEDERRRVFGIFTAPEYLFASMVSHGNHRVGDVRHLSEGTKAGLEAWVKGLSVRYPHFLLFPGSIAWKKPLQRNLADYKNFKKVAGSKLSDSDLEAKFTNKKLTRTEKAKASIRQNANDFLGGDLANQVAGNMEKLRGFRKNKFATSKYDEWWLETDDPTGTYFDGKFWTHDMDKAAYDIIHDAPSNQQKLADLGGASVSSMARNTCLIYLNGRRVAKYNKAQDYHEVLNGNDPVYVPGKSVPVFDVEGVKYGVEICLDHAYASAADRLPSAAKPDVCVILSAKVQLKIANLANPNAMVVHACSEDSWSLVGRGGHANSDAYLEAEEGDYRIYSFNV